MVGDVIELKEKHLATAKEIITLLKKSFPLDGKQKIAIGIAGESGSGKSVTAFALQKILEQQNVKSLVLQMDDYFKLPPKTNHENRLKSLDNVGIQEVDLEKLAQNIKNEYFILLPMIALGIGWASMMGLPYSMVSPSIPHSKRGIYMGVINMMIVIPMLIQTLSFGFVFKNILGNNPSSAIILAGILFLVAGLFVIPMRKSMTK